MLTRLRLDIAFLPEMNGNLTSTLLLFYFLIKSSIRTPYSTGRRDVRIAFVTFEDVSDADRAREALDSEFFRALSLFDPADFAKTYFLLQTRLSDLRG